jgi:hypothetical protein
MDLRKQLHLHPKHKKGDAAQLAAQLAPLEELDGRTTSSGPTDDPKGNFALGAIVVDNDNLSIPKDIMEGSDEKTYLGMEPVVIVILGFMLVFIAFIAWQISMMPVE